MLYPPTLILSSILIVLFSSLSLCIYIIYKPPAWLINHFQRRWPNVLFHVSTDQKIVALTIDDGPSCHTRKIQAVLDAHGAKATFFIIGSHMPGHEETLRQLILNGHELGNHAMYDEPSRSLSTVQLIRQIKDVDAQLDHIYESVRCRLSSRLKYFRPGSGFFTVQMRRTVPGLGHRIVLGDIYPHDAQIPFWRLNARHILSMVRPGGIIVCHDRRWTLPMLSVVMPELRRRGYRVVTVTELLSLGSNFHQTRAS
ncbi:hypothetical protein ABEF95_009457 [Exophiala dermatitidis]